MIEETRILMSFVPLKERGRFKALLAGKQSLTISDKRKESWVFIHRWDNMCFNYPLGSMFYYGAEFLRYRSDNMYEYDDVILFVENKGPMGYLNTKVTIVTTKLGSLIP